MNRLNGQLDMTLVVDKDKQPLSEFCIFVSFLGSAGRLASSPSAYDVP